MLKREKGLPYSAQSVIPSTNPQRQSLRSQSTGFHETLPSNCSILTYKALIIFVFLHRLFSSMTKLKLKKKWVT